MRKVTILELSILLIYVLVYKFLLEPSGSLNQYIINPVIWISFSTLLFFLHSKKDKPQYEQTSIYITVTSSLIYIILLYSSGIFVGYSKNPYLVILNSIIINFFSIVLVIGLKEYVRWILQRNIKYKIHYIFIFFIFFISDLSILDILKPINDNMDILERIVQDIVPIISINLLMMYLCNAGGYKPAILYRTLIITPTLIIPIFPKLEPSMLTLLNILFIFFTYLIIRSNINKRERMISKKVSNIKYWIIILPVLSLLVMFLLGIFPIKSAVIVTGSMRPTINPGDAVIIEKCDINNIKENDIIQYKLDNYTIVHRVIKINYDKNEIITKGDNNTNIDKPVSKDQIIGKVRFKIPYIGYPTYIIKKLTGKINVKLGDL